MGNIHGYIPRDMAFEPQDLGILNDAYDLAMLDLPSGQSRLEAAVARQIVALAAAGERDPISLCDKALACFGLLSGEAGAACAAIPKLRVAASARRHRSPVTKERASRPRRAAPRGLKAN